MCAYCVIIGDTIPHVIRSLVPGIDQIPVLWIFANRRLCISFFTLFISYPLSLYRDISKLAKASALAIISIIVIIVSVAIEAPQTPTEIRGSPDIRFNFANDEIFQAIAVISFGKANWIVIPWLSSVNEFPCFQHLYATITAFISLDL